MKICPNTNCRNFNKFINFKFCEDCGYEGIDSYRCSNGHEVSAMSSFCGECGERIENRPLVQENALDPIRREQEEKRHEIDLGGGFAITYPEDDEDLGKDDNDFRLNEDETLINA